jgi:flagellar biosynthetic protein FliQ
MEAAQVIEIGKEAIFVLIKLSAPILIVSLIVGLSISLFQALTQIQEATLSFVPKIMAIFISLIIFMPYMGNTLKIFVEHISELIIGIQ